MPTKRPYMETTERGYHPAEWFSPILLEIINKDYPEYVKVVRAKKVKGELFPIIVLAGSKDVLREMEYRYETQVRGMFPELSYDDLKKLEPKEIQKRKLFGYANP